MKRKVFIAEKLKITIPDNWTATNEDNVFTSYDPENGVGALLFTVFTVPNSLSLDLKVELSDLLEGKLGEIIVHENSVQSYYQNTENNKYWKYWLIRNGEYLIFGSYISDEEDKTIEENIVEEVVNSIQRECYPPF